MLSKQKFAVTLLVVAVGLTALGRWGIGTLPLRERDVLAIFGGGFFAALAVVRFIAQLRNTPPPATATPAATGATPTVTPPPTPPTPPPPRSKS
jgi:hypothetical protein